MLTYWKDLLPARPSILLSTLTRTSSYRGRPRKVLPGKNLDLVYAECCGHLAHDYVALQEPFILQCTDPVKIGAEICHLCRHSS
jgi:hypothetical protein